MTQTASSVPPVLAVLAWWPWRMYSVLTTAMSSECDLGSSKIIGLIIWPMLTDPRTKYRVKQLRASDAASAPL